MKKIITIAILLSFLGCENSKESAIPYELVDLANGIMVEKFDDSIMDDNKYNYNNKILIPGSKFIYDLNYMTSSKEKKSFKTYIQDKELKWDFVSPDEDDAINSVTIAVDEGNQFAKMYPDYNQTNLKYYMGNKSTYSLSGGVENEVNLWIHPPREGLLNILELNPFPYVKYPLKIGNSWQWQLEIGNGYGDYRWKTWEGIITNNYDYKIIGKENLETKHGTLECYIIESSATSELGTTSLKTHYNITYGFVVMDYVNIDGSTTKLELIQYEK